MLTVTHRVRWRWATDLERPYGPLFQLLSGVLSVSQMDMDVMAGCVGGGRCRTTTVSLATVVLDLEASTRSLQFNCPCHHLWSIRLVSTFQSGQSLQMWSLSRNEASGLSGCRSPWLQLMVKCHILSRLTSKSSRWHWHGPNGEITAEPRLGGGLRLLGLLVFCSRRQETQGDTTVVVYRTPGSRDQLDIWLLSVLYVRSKTHRTCCTCIRPRT